MEVKPGYKQTEVGIIPEDWNEFTVGELIIFEGGSQPNKSHFRLTQKPGYCRLIQIRDYKTDNFEVFVPKILARRFCDENDIMIGRYGPPVFQILRGLAGAYNVALIKAVPSEGLNREFAYYFLTQDTLFQFIDKLSRRTSGQTGVDLKELRSYPFPLPPTIFEQHAIATALSDVDALLDGLDRLIAKKRDLKQAAMQQLLTGQTRLPGFSGEWEVQTIQDMAYIGRGRVISHAEIAKSTSPNYPVYSSQTSNDGVMGYLDTYDFEGNYITWTTDGANAGTVFARSGRFNCTNVCGTIKLHNGDHRFIAAVLGQSTHPHVSRHLGNPKLMNDVMKKIEIRIPKSIEERDVRLFR